MTSKENRDRNPAQLAQYGAQLGPILHPILQPSLPHLCEQAGPILLSRKSSTPSVNIKYSLSRLELTALATHSHTHSSSRTCERLSLSYDLARIVACIHAQSLHLCPLYELSPKSLPLHQKTHTLSRETRPGKHRTRCAKTAKRCRASARALPRTSCSAS